MKKEEEAEEEGEEEGKGEREEKEEEEQGVTPRKKHPNMEGRMKR